MNRETTCCFTGHRPEKLPWREDEGDPRCLELKARERWFSLVERCDNETMLQHHYDRGCMLRRNRYLVDHSAMLIAVYDGMLGGTMYTISYAMKRGLDVVTLDIP